MRIAIVGAGIVGLAHAVAALDAGHRVIVIDQDAAAVSASIRNFGHIGTSVQTGELGELARASRTVWMDLAARAGLEVRRSGTLVVARSDAESAVLEESLAERLPADAVLLGPADAAAELGIEGSAAPVAAALLPADLTANPRSIVAGLAAWVDAHERGEVRFAVSACAVSTGLVETSSGPIRADHVIVATGHLVGRLFPELAASAGVRECALQMARVRAPHGLPLGPAVLSGTSLLRYGAFLGPASERLREELRAERPDLLEIDANVMFTQHPDGTLLVGDSHATHETAPPFLDERWSRILLAEASRILGVEGLEVLERWQGVYATSHEQDILVAHPDAGVTVATVTTGAGMSIGFGLAARTIADLSGSRPFIHA